GQRVPRSAIKAGTPVKITAASIVTGAAARKIEIGVATPSGTFFSPKKSGTVTAVAATTLELATKSRTLTFRLAASTKVERLGARLAPRSIEKGARVKVKFSIDPSGRLVAAKVRIGVPCGTEVLFSRKAKGRVTGLSGGVLTVATGGAKHLVARLTTGTKVRRLGARVPRAAIRTGRTVKLKPALGTTSRVEASSLSVETPTPFGPVYTAKE